MSAPANAKALRRAVQHAAAIRHRVSEAEARLTTDLDFARATGMNLDSFGDAYSDRLEDGWAGFTGVFKAEKSKHPDDLPGEYVMDRFSIKLRYLGQPYCSVILELVHAEIDSTETAVERLGTDIGVISAEHQIAQKLHACTGVSAGGRAHDLIDIQILAAIEDLENETMIPTLHDAIDFVNHLITTAANSAEG